MNRFSPCPQKQQCMDYLLGELEEGRDEFQTHLENCYFCQETVQEFHQNVNQLRKRPFPSLSEDLTPLIFSRLPQKKSSFLPLAISLIGLFCWVGGFWNMVGSPPSKVSRPQMSLAPSPEDWLLKHQKPDGSWPIEKWGGQPRHTQAVTCLALLALLERPPSTGRRLGLEKGVRYLLKNQRPDGSFGQGESYSLENQLLATLVILKTLQNSPKDSPQLGRALSRAKKSLYHLAQQATSPEKKQFCMALIETNSPGSLPALLPRQPAQKEQWNRAGGRVCQVALSLFSPGRAKAPKF